MRNGSEIKDAARRVIAAYNAKDAAILETLLATDFRQHSPGVPPSRDAFFKFVEASYQAFPDGRFDVEDMIAEGDKVLLRWTFRGTHLGIWPYRVAPPTGKVITFPGMDLWRFDDDRKLVEAWFIADMLGMMTQLGRAAT